MVDRSVIVARWRVDLDKMTNPYSPQAFFDLDHNLAAELFLDTTYVWEGVAALPLFIEKRLEPRILGEIEDGAWLEPGRVSLGEGSRVERGSIIRGPTIIGRNTVIRSGVYIRGNVIIGDECVIGWSVEMRQSLVLNNTRIPHFNGIYTSLIGNRSNLAGRVSTPNYRMDGREIIIRVPWDGEIRSFPTGQTLFGAVIGDDANIGGDTLFQPGAVVGRRCRIAPQCSVSGYIPHDSLVKCATAPVEVVSLK